jgi:hypothetical protein
MRGDAKMTEEYIANVKKEVAEKLINSNFELGDKEAVVSNKQTLLEQYKLLIDSADKGEEKRGTSNTIFLGINSWIASFIAHPATEVLHIQKKDMPVSILFTLIGMFIAWEWLNVNMSYKKLNFINYVMINAFEKLLPSAPFSLRAKIEAALGEEKPKNEGNAVLKKENLLPGAFFLLYFIYFITISYSFLQR